MNYMLYVTIPHGCKNSMKIHLFCGKTNVLRLKFMIFLSVLGKNIHFRANKLHKTLTFLHLNVLQKNTIIFLLLNFLDDFLHNLTKLLLFYFFAKTCNIKKVKSHFSFKKKNKKRNIFIF